MAVASIATAMRPPSASISRTRWPFAVPPIAGLHGINATVSADSVQRPTRHPSRAAAHAASTPACPAPITTTSNSLLANAETAENLTQQIFRRAAARDLLERLPRRRELSEHQLLGGAFGQRFLDAFDRLERVDEMAQVTDVR